MELNVNGTVYEVEADADTPLLWVIRDDIGLTGTKYGCGLAQCGACSVMVDGVLLRSCVTPVEGVKGKQIRTIEAIEDERVGQTRSGRLGQASSRPVWLLPVWPGNGRHCAVAAHSQTFPSRYCCRHDESLPLRHL